VIFEKPGISVRGILCVCPSWTEQSGNSSMNSNLCLFLALRENSVWNVLFQSIGM